MMKSYTCIAKTFYGLENILADELTSLQCKEIHVLNRAVKFTCDKKGLYKVNLRSRFAISVLVEWENFWSRDEEDLYKRIKKIEWDQVLSPDKTFMIKTTIPDSKVFRHSQFVGLKAKDAIADYFTEKEGKRPDVDTIDPDVKIQLHINGNKCSISLDSSGEPLFKRGYRISTGVAPMNEVLAAGIIKLSGWQPNQTFYDPMCGSGTFLIEAAMMAHNIPPGMKRRFGFQNWMNYTAPLWEQVFKEETEKVTDSQVMIIGADNYEKVLTAARENIEQAFLEDSIRVSKKDFFVSEWKKEEMPFIIFNPPYDKRLQEDDMISFFKEVGDTLKFKYPGTQAWIISSEFELMKFIGLRPSRKIKLFNGPFECRLMKFEMYKGKKHSGKESSKSKDES